MTDMQCEKRPVTFSLAPKNWQLLNFSGSSNSGISSSCILSYWNLPRDWWTRVSRQRQIGISEDLSLTCLEYILLQERMYLDMQTYKYLNISLFYIDYISSKKYGLGITDVYQSCIDT